MPDVWKVTEPLEVEHRLPIRQSSDQSNSKKKEATLQQRDSESRVEVREGSPIKRIAFDSTLSRGKVNGEVPQI